jgi:hypothetical protein
MLWAALLAWRDWHIRMLVMWFIFVGGRGGAGFYPDLV